METFSNEDEDINEIVYQYFDENTGLKAGELAVGIVNNILNGVIPDIDSCLLDLKHIAASNFFEASTQAIVNEATKRGIPYIRLNQNNYVQLGYGLHQRRIDATVMDNTSIIGAEIADDKERTKSIKSSAGIPVPKERKIGETANIVKRGLMEAGFYEKKNSIITNEREAIRKAISMAEKGDLLVKQADDIQEVMNDISTYNSKRSL